MCGGIGIIAATAAWFGLSTVLTQRVSATESLWVRMRDGFRAAKDSRIALSYDAAFISRGDLAVAGAYM